MGDSLSTVGAKRLLHGAWAAGAAGGLVGGIGMGVSLHAGSNMMPLTGALYGWPTVFGGWLAHSMNSAAIGSVFCLLASQPFVREQTATITGCVAVSIVYATAVGLVTGGIVLPAAMSVVGTDAHLQSLLPLPELPSNAVVPLSVGLVYGLLLGIVYGTLHASSAPDR